MKKLITIISLLAIGSITSSCASQVSAQKNLLETPTPSPATIDTSTLPSLGTTPDMLPRVPNPSADIGKSIALEKALKEVSFTTQNGSPEVIEAIQTTFENAYQLEPELAQLSEVSPVRAQIPVYVVELKGNFDLSRVPQIRPSSELGTARIAKKSYVILRRADGYVLAKAFLEAN